MCVTSQSSSNGLGIEFPKFVRAHIKHCSFALKLIWKEWWKIPCYNIEIIYNTSEDIILLIQSNKKGMPSRVPKFYSRCPLKCYFIISMIIIDYWVSLLRWYWVRQEYTIDVSTLLQNIVQYRICFTSLRFF